MAFTGEIAGEMLKEAGATWVIVGHSERRQQWAESDLLVASKCKAAVRAGLQPIVCVGETLAEREAGQAVDVVSRQVEAVAEGAGITVLADAVIGYEPVWAIGTGVTATPEQAQEMHAAIRALLDRLQTGLGAAATVIYGGSVNDTNAAALFAQPDIDGGLVGGASLDAEKFVAIAEALAAR